MSHSISKVELSGAYFRPKGIVAMQRSSGNEEIIIERDHNNQYDENAVEVFMVTPGFFFNKKISLGFVEKDVAGQIANDMDNGQKFTVKLDEIWIGGEVAETARARMTITAI